MLTKATKKGKGAKGRGKGSSQKQRENQQKNDTKEWRPTAQQVKMIGLVIDFEDRRSLEAKAKEVKISRKTYYNWLNNPEFVKLMNSMLEQVTDSATVDVTKALLLAARRGNIQAIRTFFELKGKIGRAVELTGKGGGPVETTGSVQVVFGMAEPPGKRIETPVEGDNEDE